MLALKINPHLTECGTDEAGRGCLAGPVTAAAVILPDGFSHPWLTDSKQLSEKKRLALQKIIKTQAVAYTHAHVPVHEIEKLNILYAAIRAMHRSIKKLEPRPQFIAVDGNRFKTHPSIPHQCVVKGDSKYLHIAAASIIAKTERDALMVQLHKKFPQYHWDKNKGYPTKAHRRAIAEYGPTPYHRKGFKLL
ncbi:MAG: ribonuclease HII [Marinirhabdus sp.]